MKERQHRIYAQGKAPFCSTRISDFQALGPGVFLYFKLLVREWAHARASLSCAATPTPAPTPTLAMTLRLPAYIFPVQHCVLVSHSHHSGHPKHDFPVVCVWAGSE